MESDPLSYILTRLYLSFLLFLGLIPASATSFGSVDAEDLMRTVEDEVKERLASLDQSLVEHRYDKSVRNLINFHLRHPRQTELNIGRAVAYFPLFEEELIQADLPTTLKYLPLIESSLRPDALSWVGAKGLWQFMPATALEYDMRIDSLVDERMDILKSTRAAITYLQRAHEYTEDWSMAIAAYNCGRGRARRAQRRSGRKNFWGARRYLPRETRRYLPAFIAAVYLSEFYQIHEIEPDFPSLDEQLMEVITVDKPISFYRLAQITGLSIDLIERHNPQFIKGYIPAYPGGHNLFLPSRVIPALRTYLENVSVNDDEPALPWLDPIRLPVYTPQDGAYYETYHWPVMNGDSLSSISALTDIPLSRLYLWNGLNSQDSLIENQEIRYFRPVVFTKSPRRPVHVVNSLSYDENLPNQLTSDLSIRRLPKSELTQIRYYLNRAMQPAEVNKLFPGLFPQTSSNWKNKLRLKKLPAGTELMVRQP